MATLVVEIPSYTGSANQTTQEVTVSYTPPANISGKLCRLSVNEFLVSSETITTMAIFKIEADLPQPYGTNIRKWSSTRPNRVLATNMVNTVYTAPQRSIIIQMPEGPTDITFKLSTVTSTTIVGTGNKTADILLMLTITPVDRNQHFEKLESFSTGPNIRV